MRKKTFCYRYICTLSHFKNTPRRPYVYLPEIQEGSIETLFRWCGIYHCSDRFIADLV